MKIFNKNSTLLVSMKPWFLTITIFIFMAFISISIAFAKDDKDITKKDAKKDATKTVSTPTKEYVYKTYSLSDKAKDILGIDVKLQIPTVWQASEYASYIEDFDSYDDDKGGSKDNKKDKKKPYLVEINFFPSSLAISSNIDVFCSLSVQESTKKHNLEMLAATDKDKDKLFSEMNKTEEFWYEKETHKALDYKIVHYNGHKGIELTFFRMLEKKSSGEKKYGVNTGASFPFKEDKVVFLSCGVINDKSKEEVFKMSEQWEDTFLKIISSIDIKSL
ncbi:MAG: hypothetical protein ACOX3T_03270 [Bdellovibrionota bacterium]